MSEEGERTDTPEQEPYEPPAIEVLGTLESLTLSGAAYAYVDGTFGS
jgi:hypothetical protein